MSHYLRLKSGRQLDVHGIIGICFDRESENHLDVFFGNDGNIETVIDSNYRRELESGEELTRAECLEIADLMICTWNDYRKKIIEVNFRSCDENEWHSVSLERKLLTVPGFTPFCCNDQCNVRKRTTFDVNVGQFCCLCGWRSKFRDEFIVAYRGFRIDSQRCSKCGVTVAENKSKYCGDGTDKDNAHRWVMPVYLHE